MKFDIKCEKCGIVVGSVELKDNATEEQKRSALSGYTCQDCIETIDTIVE